MFAILGMYVVFFFFWLRESFNLYVVYLGSIWIALIAENTVAK